MTPTAYTFIILAHNIMLSRENQPAINEYDRVDRKLFKLRMTYSRRELKNKYSFAHVAR